MIEPSRELADFCQWWPEGQRRPCWKEWGARGAGYRGLQLGGYTTPLVSPAAGRSQPTNPTPRAQR